MSVLAIILGGGIGATLRYVLGLGLAPPTPPDFPWVTFVVNLVGAFASRCRDGAARGAPAAGAVG
ncbi:hypothetical protein GCM10027280_45780 [Micromonospora polyrhachis]